MYVNTIQAWMHATIVRVSTLVCANIKQSYTYSMYIFHIFRSNFLRLDVYYPALTFEQVEQHKAYGPMNFLGEFMFAIFQCAHGVTLL